MAKTPLTLMHVPTDATSEWTDFPGVLETLGRRGWLPKDSPRSALRGSHNERVLRQAPAPLLTVHPAVASIS